MDATEIMVTAAGALAAIWVAWYFLLGERRQVRAIASADGGLRVRVVVKGGYDPSTIVAERGRPLSIDFYRDETEGCSDTVVFGEFGISRKLPPHRTTTVAFTPERAGEYLFTCGMNMLRGKVIVKDAGDDANVSPEEAVR